MTQHTIRIQGAREHNLQNISLEIPKGKLVVITGLSGSGKSSLAFDTIYAEGQRRYVESLSAYARQFLSLMQKPDVDAIDGLSPAIAIEQKTTSKNPRSTVGTTTEIYDYLRLLYARIGIPYSPATGLPISSQTVGQVVDQIMTFPAGTRLYILAPLIRGRKGLYQDLFKDLSKKGYTRVIVNDVFYNIEDVPALDKQKKHHIAVVIDRIVCKPDIEKRLADSVEIAFNLGEGLVIARDAETEAEHLFSEKFACPVSGFTIEEIEPRLFSFNSPFGACPTCDGLGVTVTFDADRIIPDPRLSVLQGAVAPWSGGFSFYYKQLLSAVITFFGEDPVTPFNKLSKETQGAILHGTGLKSIPMMIEDEGRIYNKRKPFEGVIPTLQRRYQQRENKEDTEKDAFSKYQSTTCCTVCGGARLKPEALAVKVDGRTISEITGLSIHHAREWIDHLPQQLSEKERTIGTRILKEIRERLCFLESVGLSYLSLSRASGTLSGGESQRIRLASQIGAGLTGVLYVLDEPSIGLHQRDNDRLLTTLKNLRDLGNTVIVVEHDEDAIKAADYIIDMGPGAGIHGGRIIAAGTLEQIYAVPESLTGQYLKGEKEIACPVKYREGNGYHLVLTGASANNLQALDVTFPLGKMICVTGVSGGGKSSLVIETLYKALARDLNGNSSVPGPYTGLEGIQHIDKIIDIDQAPIGRTPRSNPATYTGVFTPLREWFSKLPEAKARGYGPGRFSFNVKGGRCETCTGDGVIKIAMHFLPDVFVTCDQCQGKRYNRETLEVLYKEKSIADILDMTVAEGLDFFQAIPGIRSKLETLDQVGLGYIHIGQQATTLSGGEAQRVKLAKELSRRSTGKTLYILDEPTTGLHFDDIRKLLEVLHELVDQGNSMIIIEHNLDVIKTADWIIDIGPEGGSGGGTLVAEGTPAMIVKNKKSHTGQYLKPLLKKA